MGDVENVNEKIEYDIMMQKIKENLLQNLKEYKKKMSYMTSDAPIAILCLPKEIERILSDSGCLRVYDLLDRDFTKIEGLGESGIRKLTTRFNEFISML